MSILSNLPQDKTKHRKVGRLSFFIVLFHAIYIANVGILDNWMIFVSWLIGIMTMTLAACIWEGVQIVFNTGVGDWKDIAWSVEGSVEGSSVMGLILFLFNLAV